MMENYKFSSLINKPAFKRFLKFSIVGGIIFIINTSLLWFVRQVLNVESFFSIWGIFVFVTTCHFLMSNFFAFKDSRMLYRKRIIRYVIYVALSTFIASMIVNAFLTHIANNILLATIVAAAIMMFINFNALNKFVFPKKEAHE